MGMDVPSDADAAAALRGDEPSMWLLRYDEPAGDVPIRPAPGSGEVPYSHPNARLGGDSPCGTRALPPRPQPWIPMGRVTDEEIDEP